MRKSSFGRPAHYGAVALAAALLLGATVATAQDKTLVVGAAVFPDNLSTSTSSFAALSLAYQTMDPLVLRDNNGKLLPGLATAWEAVDPQTWRFTLRSGTTFSNGEPVNAAAVVATIEYLMSEEGKATSVGREVGHLSGASAIDDLTVEITTSRPDPVLTNRLALVSIVEPGQWAALGAEGFADQPVGTGPYQVSAWGAGDVTLTANGSSNAEARR